MLRRLIAYSDKVFHLSALLIASLTDRGPEPRISTASGPMEENHRPCPRSCKSRGEPLERQYPPATGRIGHPAKTGFLGASKPWQSIWLRYPGGRTTGKPLYKNNVPRVIEFALKYMF